MVALKKLISLFISCMCCVITCICIFISCQCSTVVGPAGVQSLDLQPSSSNDVVFVSSTVVLPVGVQLLELQPCSTVLSASSLVSAGELSVQSDAVFVSCHVLVLASARW